MHANTTTSHVHFLTLHTPPWLLQPTYPKYSFNSSESSSCCLNENGVNGHPLNSANLEKDSTQARRSE